MLDKAVKNIFVQLTASLDQLTEEQYGKPCIALFQASVGQHVRHIIELFQCLQNGYAEGVVNYEHRKRDISIENDKSIAVGLLHEILEAVNKPDKKMVLESCYNDDSTDVIKIETNYFREVAYNLEHTIHHMALIRIGINEVADIKMSETYGVASSTTRHKKECAQ